MIKIKSLNKNCLGYIALSSVLIVALMILTIGISVTYLAISETQVSLSTVRKEDAIGYVDSCVEEVLLRLNETNAIPTVIPFPLVNCSVTINSQVGNNWTYTATVTNRKHKKTKMVQATRGVYITVSNWKEIE